MESIESMDCHARINLACNDDSLLDSGFSLFFICFFIFGFFPFALAQGQNDEVKSINNTSIRHSEGLSPKNPLRFSYIVTLALSNDEVDSVFFIFIFIFLFILLFFLDSAVVLCTSSE
ncbi:hypothetical protein [Helicobacter fennelliae]|uniref:hypothetical protein n=1 Tax=Helicobacter fennelliae TaxID=215 RepID=UPI000E0FA4E6|nr:hypothetical protein [Helicobacter fennelliae]